MHYWHFDQRTAHCFDTRWGGSRYLHYTLYTQWNCFETTLGAERTIGIGTSLRDRPITLKWRWGQNFLSGYRLARDSLFGICAGGNILHYNSLSLTFI